jgi:hypothetical protein
MSVTGLPNEALEDRQRRKPALAADRRAIRRRARPAGGRAASTSILIAPAQQTLATGTIFPPRALGMLVRRLRSTTRTSEMVPPVFRSSSKERLMSRRRVFALFAAAGRQAASLARSAAGGPLNRSARQEVPTGGGFRRRRFAPTLAAAVVALGLGSGTAFAAPNDAAMFVQTATRGTFDHGRLTLRGVTRHVAWFTDRPARDSGVVSFAAFRRGLFSRRQPAPNAALDVSGSGP